MIFFLLDAYRLRGGFPNQATGHKRVSTVTRDLSTRSRVLHICSVYLSDTKLDLKSGGIFTQLLTLPFISQSR